MIDPGILWFFILFGGGVLTGLGIGVVVLGGSNDDHRKPTERL